MHVRGDMAVRTGPDRRFFVLLFFFRFAGLSDATEETSDFWYIFEGNQEIFFYRICEADPLTAFVLGMAVRTGPARPVNRARSTERPWRRV